MFAWNSCSYLDMIRVSIRSSAGDASISANETMTIGELMRRVAETFGICVNQQELLIQEDIDPGNLDLVEEVADSDDEQMDTATGAESAESAMEEEADEDKHPADRSWTFEKKKKVVDFFTASPGRTFKSVKQRFRTINERQFHRFRKQVAAGGSTQDKWRRVDEEVLQKMREARRDKLPVHGADLRRWALNAASAIGLQTSVSASWLHEWKKRHGIVSRKVSQVWSTAKLEKAAETEAAAVEFRKLVLSKLGGRDPDMIMNIDQSGYQYEYFSERTLSFKGEHATPIAIRSMSRTTHSYTIQPTLSLSGKLQSPLFLCTQEPGGKMGPLVRESYFKPKNVAVSSLFALFCVKHLENSEM